MAKRLCKLSRNEIATSLGEIERLVAEPQFLCRSCARVAADKKSLCKPQALSAKSPAAPTLSAFSETETSKDVVSLLPKSRLKKQQKFHKKLEKVLKKQRKLMKKQQQLEGKVAQTNPALVH